MIFNLGYNPLYDARFFGSSVFEATALQTTDHYITFEFATKLSGIDIYSNTNEIGHKISIVTEYPIGGGAYKRFKKSTKGWNIFPNQKDRIQLFPVDPVAGIRLKISYTNTSEANCKFAINLFTFIDQVTIDTANQAEGVDW